VKQRNESEFNNFVFILLTIYQATWCL